MLNKESEYTYVTSKDADVENGDFGKNVGVDIVTEKMSIRHGGLDEGGGSSVLDDLIEGKSGVHLVSNAESVADTAFACIEQEDANIGLGWYLESVDLPNATSIGNRAFYNCSALSSVNLPNVTSIGIGAFDGCSALTNVDLPNATSIGVGAFARCFALSSVNLPNATSIDKNAFAGCSALTSISLLNATSIGSNAFNGCSALTSISLPNATSIGKNAFAQISSTAVINLGAAEGEISGAPWGAPEGVTINYNVK